MPEMNVNRIWETVMAVLLASAGGFARLLNVKDRRRMRLRRIFSELFISAFAGMMILLLARVCGLSGDWVGLVCGVGGWIGPRILDLMVNPVKKALGLDMEDDKHEIAKE